jgi:hypothetical protein
MRERPAGESACCATQRTVPLKTRRDIVAPADGALAAL